MDSPLIARLKSLSPKVFVSSPPATREMMERLEELYEVKFPDDYRELKFFTDGLSVRNGGSLLDLESVADTISHLEDQVLERYLPGTILIGTDGGGLLYYYDPKGQVGRGAFAVFMTSFSAPGFAKSKFVGKDITESIDRALAGVDFWELPYLGPGASPAGIE